MKKKYIIWDFDGTVLDSNGIILDSWQSVFMHYTGKPGDPVAIVKTFGETLYDSMVYFFPDIDADEGVELYRKWQVANVSGALKMFDGVEDVLKGLKEAGHVMAIVTSRKRETTHQYVDELGIREYFDMILTCDDIAAHKPDPAPLLFALDKLGASKEESIMIGDTKFDIGCANNAGVDSVLVGWSHVVDEEEMAALGFAPTYHIARPEDLYELV